MNWRAAIAIASFAKSEMGACLAGARQGNKRPGVAIPQKAAIYPSCASVDARAPASRKQDPRKQIACKRFAIRRERLLSRSGLLPIDTEYVAA
jgi:hypothetical protein